MRVPVDPYIPNPLRCFNCQKYCHSSRACKNSAACVKCREAGHEGANCSHQELYINCKGKHTASSRECPKWKLGTLIPVVEQTKFLGVIFDNKLTFLPHIRYLKEQCVKALNLLRVVAHTCWGADQHTLLHLYRSLVRSKLDYGSIIYGSAQESYVYCIRYRTMHCGYVWVPSEPHLALVYAFKPTNLHSTYGEEC